MKKNWQRRWLPLAIGVAFVAVSLLGVVTYRNTIAIRRGERRVVDSYAVREATHRLLSAVKDMETGQRGYLLTGNPLYLQAYQLGVDHIDQGFERLQDLTSRNKLQSEHLGRLRELVTEKRADIDQTIELRRKEPAAGVSEQILALVSSNVGKQKMDAAREVVDAILEEERKQLEQHETNASALSALSRTSILVGNTAALGLILITGAVAYFDRRRRDEAESALQAKQAELSAVVDSVTDGIVTFNSDLTVRMMNPSAAHIHAADSEKVAGQCMLDFVAPNFRELAQHQITEFLESDRSSQPFSGVGLRGNGAEFPCHGTLSKAEINGVQFNTLMFQDLTEQRASEARKRELAAILEQVRDAIIVCDLKDRILSWNKGAELLYQQTESEAIRKPVTDVLFAGRSDLWEAGRSATMEERVFVTEVQHIGKDRREIVVEHRRSLIRDEAGEPVAQLIFDIDVTDRKREEAKQRRSQRLESIGTLAGGVAHDLNNILTPILMNAKLVQRGSRNEERLLETIIVSAERGGKMIKKLLAFAGGERSLKQTADLRAILSEAQDILAHTLPKSIDLSVSAADDTDPVSADPTELSQVIMNLAINARDAMPAGGRLAIELSNFYIKPSRARASDILKSGPHVLLMVSDSGDGVPEQLVDRIFDPFFTTKPQGKGTGLGLATSLGIVRSYGGDITVYSEVGIGSKFSVYLPSSRSSTTASGIICEEDELPAGSGETILVVDDESLIVEAARECLETSGYRVVSATNGADALAVFQHRSEEIDLVLLDMMMPGMDGIETSHGLRSIDSTAKIIASSGLRRPGVDGGKMDEVDGFLAKPYSNEQLLQAVRRVLDTKETTKAD